MMPAIINTIVMTLVTLLFAVPVGVFSAIYLVEYAKRGNKLVKVGPYDYRNTVRYSLYRLRPVRISDVWCGIPLGLFHVKWCPDPGDYGAAVHYENHRGSIESSTGFLSGKEALAWEPVRLRTVFVVILTKCDSWYPGRCDPGYRTYHG